MRRVINKTRPNIDKITWEFRNFNEFLSIELDIYYFIFTHKRLEMIKGNYSRNVMINKLIIYINDKYNPNIQVTNKYDLAFRTLRLNIK